MDRTERELVEMMGCAERDEIFAEHAAFLERAYRIERQRTKRLRAELEAARDKACAELDAAYFALESYGDHHSDCSAYRNIIHAKECQCGLWAAKMAACDGPTDTPKGGA